jgi:hypothetical protein
MPTIIHVSRDFAKRYRCELSLPGERVLQAGRLDSWSAHVVRISRKPMALFMNDATLWSMIVPATGVTSLADILRIFLDQVADVWGSHGAAFDPSNQDVLFFSRSNRSLIGSMNDAASMMRYAEELAREEKTPADWDEVEGHLNRTTYKAIGRARPRDLMAELLKGDG